MIAKLFRVLRAMAAGKRLSHAIEQNEQAADRLDGLLREVLKR